MPEKRIAVLAGDGIGPEIMEEGVKILRAVGDKYGHRFDFQEALIGGCAYDKTGHPLPGETREVCDNSDAIYFGAIGGPGYEGLPPKLTPERGALLPLRKDYGLYANLRPAVIFGPLAGSASLKDKRLGNGMDILIVRELTGGIYFGEHETDDGITAADEMRYSVPEIERISEVACKASLERDRRLTSVDKANVLDASKLWRRVVSDYVPKNYPGVELSHMYVDNAAMQLGTEPKQFDVIVTGNMFGDILSDLASAITGSIGMLPSASLREDGFGMYEPVHGSAPDIAGQGQANPLAQILSGSMMLRYSFGLGKESDAVDNAVNKVLDEGYRTFDIADDETEPVSTQEMGDKVLEALEEGE